MRSSLFYKKVPPVGGPTDTSRARARSFFLINTVFGTPQTGLKLHEIDADVLLTKTSFPCARKQVRERASERMSAAERASKASCADQVSEQCERMGERTGEWPNTYSTRRFHNYSTHSELRVCYLTDDIGQQNKDLYA